MAQRCRPAACKRLELDAHAAYYYSRWRVIFWRSRTTPGEHSLSERLERTAVRVPARIANTTPVTRRHEDGDAGERRSRACLFRGLDCPASPSLSSQGPVRWPSCLSVRHEKDRSPPTSSRNVVKTTSGVVCGTTSPYPTVLKDCGNEAVGGRDRSPPFLDTGIVIMGV